MTRKLGAMPSKFRSYDCWNKRRYLVVVEPDDLQVGEILKVSKRVEPPIRQVHLN